MKVTIDARNLAEAVADVLVLPLAKLDPASLRLPPRIAALDRALEGHLSTVLSSGDFRGRSGESMILYPGAGIRAKRLLLVGLGDERSLDAEALRSAAGTMVSRSTAKRAEKVVMAVPAARRVRAPDAVQALAEGATLSGYRFEQHRSPRDDAPGEIKSLTLSLDRANDVRAARPRAARGVILAESQNVARALSNEPANELPPAELARRAQKVAREVGLRVRVFDAAELKRRKMGAILAVGSGSANTPRLVVLEHNAPKARAPKGRSAATVCLVGKGITFDSGGISIKPSAGMDEMKHDMSGAATVVGALRACALLKLPLHVVGVVAAAENMPSGTAYRPGDVVKTLSGKTIEVLNTDAEGRVVLADALHFAKTEFEPAAIVDLATLTGAVVVALGKHATGLFGNNERLVEVVRRAGETVHERCWPLPLWEGHKKAVRSNVADIKNTAGREAASSTAAAFLSNFVGDTPWVHLDIAGTGWSARTGPYHPRGATGVGVRLLVEMLTDWKAKKLD